MPDDILLTTSIIIKSSDDKYGDEPRTEEISDQLLHVLKITFNNHLDVQVVGVVGYHWLADNSVNSGCCSKCNQWVTNRNQPDALNGLPEATLIDGNLVCDHCRADEFELKRRNNQPR